MYFLLKRGWKCVYIIILEVIYFKLVIVEGHDTIFFSTRLGCFGNVSEDRFLIRRFLSNRNRLWKRK